MIDLTYFWNSKGKQEDLFQYKMLGTYRRDVIEIKDKLRVSIENSKSFISYVSLLITVLLTAYRIHKRVGKVTKENAAFITTHRLLEHKERFMRIHTNANRGLMIEKVFDIIIAVNESDLYYAGVLNDEAKQISEDIVSGRWPDIGIPKVLRPCWGE